MANRRKQQASTAAPDNLQSGHSAATTGTTTTGASLDIHQRSFKTPRPQPLSSFFGIPAYAHSAVAEIVVVFSLLGLSPIHQQIPEPLPHLLHLSKSRLYEIWALAFSSILRDGHLAAFFTILGAILANHVRRTLFPWLGMCAQYTPLADLKLAISSPHVFLDEAALGSTSLRGVFFVTGHKVVFDLVGALALRALLIQDGPRRVGRPYLAVVAIARTTVLVWLLTNAEYFQARTIHVVAVCIAYGKLLVHPGTPAHNAALWHVMAAYSSTVSGTLSIALHICQVGYYLIYAVLPLVAVAVSSAVGGSSGRPRPGLLAVLGFAGYTTYFVTRYSNKYYMVLELWGLVLVLGWTMLAAVALALRTLRMRVAEG